MTTPRLDSGFREYLLGIADISERDLDKLVAELADHWHERQDRFVLRRARELQRVGVPSRLVYGLIRGELATRRYGSRPMSERQIRRLIYG